MTCPDDERFLIDFESIDVANLLSDEEPVLSALRDNREPELEE